jgi:choline dehydrogenase-like flavoprotein
VAIAEPVAGFLAATSPRTRAGVRLALRALELSALPRGFSRLPAPARAERLRRLERSRIGLRRDLLLVLKTLCSVAYTRDERVRSIIGWEPRCETAGDPPDLPRLDPLALEPPADVERCDVAIVGSGAGGAAAARALAERGVAVIVVEEGAYHDRADYTQDPFEALPALYRDAGLTAAEGRPTIPLPLGRCVGGTTVINSGTCLRAPDRMLVRWREEFGIPWATELGAEYERLERDLDVRPVDAARAGRNAELCRAGAAALGFANGPVARNAGDVVRCGSCATGCPLDGKRAMHVTELPRAVAAGARVRAGARAERILLEHGRAVGVACRAPHGRYEVRAQAVVLAAGAVGTPELLLRQGIAGSSGALGRHLRIQPACWVGARFDEEVRGWDGIMQSWSVHEWRERGLFLEATSSPLPYGAPWLRGIGAQFKERLERYGRLAIIGVHIAERESEGRVTVRGRGARIRYRLSAGDAAGLRFGIARAAEIHFAAGACEAYPQVGRIEALAPGQARVAIEDGRFGPSDLRLEAFHPMGTARIGPDARTAVADVAGESHDVPGLFVADASLFPTSLSVNPMLTIMACSRRIAAGLADRLD